MTLTDDEIEDIACAIRHYLLSKYMPITDVYASIDNRVLIDDDSVIYAYNCPCQTIYLDENNYAVTCGRQHVLKVYYDEEDNIVDENDDYAYMIGTVYYDFRDEIPIIPVGFEGDTSSFPAWTKLNDYEWKRSKSGGGGVRG